MPVSTIVRRQMNGIASGLTRMLPGCRVTGEASRPAAGGGLQPGEVGEWTPAVEASSSPAAEEKPGTYETSLRVGLPGGQTGTFTVARALVSFSDAERDLLAHVAAVLRRLSFAEGADDDGLRAELIANGQAFERLVVTQYLGAGPAGGAPPEEAEKAARESGGDASAGAPGRPVQMPQAVIDQLQALALDRYEGRPMASGFVVAADPERFVREKVEPSPGYRYKAFSQRVALSERFFEQPASFHYVDGRGAFYLMDPRGQAHGLLRCTGEQRFGPVAEAALEHLGALLPGQARDAWIGYVGSNDDVNLVITPSKHLRWLKSHWHFVDRYHLSGALERHGLAQEQIEDMVAVLLAVSQQRLGALVLFPDDAEQRPEAAGVIDDTELGGVLRETLIGETVATLRRERAAMGLLTSDGMTTVSKQGRIEGCGEIVRVGGGGGHSNGGDGSEGTAAGRAGGGRTQAALAASRYGLVIKISEDGPISFFEDGRQRLRIVF